MVNNQINKLLYYSGRGELENVRAILDSGIDVNSVNEYGGTALMSAVSSYRSSVVSFLLMKGADPRAYCKDGRTVLHAAVGSTPSLPEEQAACTKLLIEAGADVDGQTDTGITPLMNASWFGCTLSVKILLAAGASQLLRDKEGRTAEDLARIKNHEEILLLLASKRTA